MQRDGGPLRGLRARWWRIGGAAGIVFLVLFIIGNGLTGETPSWDDSIEEIREYFSEDDDQYLVGDYLNGLAFVTVFLIFLTHLRSPLGIAEGSPGTWSRLAFAGGLLCLILGGTASTFWGALAFGGAEGLDDSTLRAFMYAYAYAYSFLSFGIAVFTGAASLVILIGSRVLWRWIGWLGVVVAILSLIAPLYVLDGDEESFLGALGFASFIGFALWILATSINMLVLKALPGSTGEPAEA